MSSLELTGEQQARFGETRQPELWGCLVVFLIVNNLAIAGRVWGTRQSAASRSRFLAEDFFIVLSGIFANIIIANLMVATYYGLGLHVYTINAKDENYPSNLSKTFRHVWITMVLMSSFFVSIKLALLFFYRRLFLVSASRLRIFWWANLVYVVLWFIGSTSFYLFQCQPVQWYFMQYYERFSDKPVPGGMAGQCDATTVVHVSLPLVFSLISDLALLVLPLLAVSKLHLNSGKKRGLMAVFGIGLVACFLELARVLELILDTDDKEDPSYGVAVFLLLTAAEETTAVVCACLPVVIPQLLKRLKRRTARTSDTYKARSEQGSSGSRSSRGFRRVASMNNAWALPTTNDARKGDTLPLRSIDIQGGHDASERHGRGSGRGPGSGEVPCFNHPGNIKKVPGSHETSRHGPLTSSDWPVSGGIHVRTDIQVRSGQGF
ncbi:hypothetical protein F5Y15DRAFT_416844 [Xylariaceae sp. FL0016]|nr:hypothetical protein F5Y15DRAFT_416844 [Xylariaceae sp. FL0016]